MQQVTTAEELSQQAADNRPAVWRRAFADRSELRCLHLDALKKELGDKPVLMSQTLDGVALISHARRPNAALEKPLSAVESEAVYVSQLHAGMLSPDIQTDVVSLWDRVGLGTRALSTNLWVGAAETGSPMHFDAHGNIMLQIEGEKDLYFASPDSVECVELCSNTWGTHLVRQVSEELNVQRIRLRAGDIFYLPRNWLHATRNLSVAIMANYWFKDNFIPNRITVLLIAKNFSHENFGTLCNLVCAPTAPKFLHEQDLSDLVTIEQRITAFLLDAKASQDIIKALPGIRDRQRIGTGLEDFREVLGRVAQHMPRHLHADLVHYFDQAAAVLESALRNDYSESFELAELGAISRALDAHSQQVADAELLDPRQRVGWQNLEARSRILDVG